MDPNCIRGLAKKLVKKSIPNFSDILWEQLHYLGFYGQNIEQLNERLVELTLERNSIQHRIDEATSNEKQIEEKVLQWLLKVDEISEQVQQLHRESQAKRECSITSCPNPWLRYKLSKRAKAMARQVADICEKADFDRVSDQASNASIEASNPEKEEEEGTCSNHIEERRLRMDLTCFRDLVLNLTRYLTRYLTSGFAEVFPYTSRSQIWEHLVYYGQNIEQLNERLVELTLERNSIKHRIDEARNIADQEIDDKVLYWMGKVDEISEQVQQLHRRSQVKRECSIASCPNLWLRYELSKRAKAIAQEVANICEKGNFYRVSYRVPPQQMPSNKRVDSMNQIMEALRNPSVNMIGLCGLGGVGKTTIAKEVGKNQNMFEKVIMAIVSDKLDVVKIQDQIAEKLGMQLNEGTEDVRASRLRDRLKQEKNMLLILDDLWEELDLGKVGIPLIEGCKILLTSREEMLLSNRMNCQKVIEVGALSMDEALELFKKIAELPIVSSSSDLMSIATEIVRKCGGLPLAIATAAKALRGKDLNEWKHYHARLNNPLRRNITGIKEVDTILKVSVDLLSSENKDIFLLTSMLSHDPLIEELLMYAVGLDILKGIDNMKEAHKGIFAIINKLKSLNLFLDSFSSERVTINDMVRDVALSMASNELHVFVRRRLKEWPDENMLEDCKGICLQESDISVDLPKELHCPNLQFFHLDSTERDLIIPSMFFKSSKELKVLELTNVQFLSLRLLSFLQKLKALCLHSCLLEDITEVRNLKKLKVLSLAYSEIQWLPIELAELTSLQMLNLSHCSKLEVIPPKILCSLKKLEVLYMGNSFNNWNVEGSIEINENVSLDELKDLPISFLDIHIPNVSMLPEDLFLDMNLKRYRIFIGKCWKWQGNYRNSKTLKLELESSIHLKRGVQKLLEGVEDLSLYGSNGIGNVLYSHGHLQIESIDDVEYISLNSTHHEAAATNNISNRNFESLFKVLLPKSEILELSNLHRLNALIWDDQLSQNLFMYLRTLIVKSCGFVKLAPLHVLKSLNNLEKLEVRDCDILEMVFDFEDLNDYKGMESSSMFVPLKKLKLWNLPKLKNVWGDDPQGIVSFSSLRSVRVSCCESLTSMFPASIARGMLCDLEELRIDHCEIDAIVANDQVSESADAVFEFPRMTSLELSSLPNLRNFYTQRHRLKWPHLQRRLSMQHCDELEIFEKKVSSSSEIHEEESILNLKYPLLSQKVLLPKLEILELSSLNSSIPMIWDEQLSHNSFSHLKTLIVKDCGFVKLVPLHVLQSLNNLEELEVRHCEMLEMMFDLEDLNGSNEIVSSSVVVPLKKLKLWGLPKLKNVWSDDPQGIVSFPSLRSVHVSDCKSLASMFPASIAKSMLRLEELCINKCGINAIVEKDQVSESVSAPFELTSLSLSGLPNLRSFF